jgi:hypothetical protein
MSRHILRTITLVLTLVLALGVWSTPAAADSVSYTLTQLNESGFPSPYGTVNVSLSGSTATFTFTAATNSSSGGDSFVYAFVDSSSAGLSVNSTNFTYNNDASLTQASFAPHSPSVASTGNLGNVDGWGSFNFGINLQDGSGSAAASITFSITDNTSSWVHATDVLTGNNDGNLVVAHVVPFDNTTQTLFGNNTGFATNGPSAPEPTSIAIGLLSAAGVSLTGFVRSRRQGTVYGSCQVNEKNIAESED